MFNPYRYPFVYALLLWLVIFIDQAGKLAVRQRDVVQELIGRHLVYGYFSNEGIGFGLTVPYRVIIVAVSLAIAGLLFWLVRAFHKKQIFLIWGVSITCAGALSNLVDRIAYRHVVDYFSLFGWPVFNFADILILGGVLLIMLSWFRPAAGTKSMPKTEKY